MEALSRSLQPYKQQVGDVASYLTIAQFFSGMFICRDIYKKGTSKDANPMPFIGGVAMSILNLKYGLMLNDEAMITVNVAAITLNIMYSVFFYFYAEDKYAEFLKPTGIATCLVGVLLGYTEVESAENVEVRFGFILTVLMLALLGAPLADLKDIIAKQDASSIPFPMTFMGAIVTFLWLIYGIILLNGFMMVQNVIGCILCLVQLVLIFKYPAASNPSAVQSQSKKKKNSKKE